MGVGVKASTRIPARAGPLGRSLLDLDRCGIGRGSLAARLSNAPDSHIGIWLTWLQLGRATRIASRFRRSSACSRSMRYAWRSRGAMASA
jgi:hypothetical protein